MHDRTWTKERSGDLAERILAKSRSHLPDNLQALHDHLTVKLGIERSPKGNHVRADFALGGVPYISKTSWYEPGRKVSAMDTRLVQNLSIVDSLAQDRQTDNSLLIENNVYAYLGQWLSDEQILNLMSDTTRGVRLITKKTGPNTTTTKTESIGNGRSIEIYERSSGRMHKQMVLQVTRGCMFGQWRLSPEAKWVDHGIVVRGIFPETILASMATVGDIIQHPTIEASAPVAKAKAASKTTRFSIAVQVTRRNTIIHRAGRCSGQTPYTYRML